MKSQKLYKEKGVKYLFFISAAFSTVAVIGIIVYLFAESLPAFKEIGIFNFLFCKLWLPDNEALANSEKFGILPMIVSSLCITGGAVIIGGIVGVLLATFAVKFCPNKLKGAFTQIINLLSGIPSIIYGFVGLQILVPLLAKVSPSGTGYGILASSIVLGLMILPTVTGIASYYYDSAIALGATKAQAVYRVMLPAAKSGVVTGLILGVGRAIGETMAVLMVCGNSPLFSNGLFGMIFFSEILGLGYSLLAGSFTMALMTLPTIIRSTEESLIAVSNEQREASLALGAGKLRTIYKVVLPAALSGVATAVILSIGRIVGESAALIYTAGSSILMPKGLLDMGATFAVLIWKFSIEGRAGGIEKAFATASVLIIIVAIQNLIVFLIKKKGTSQKPVKNKNIHSKLENSKIS